MTATKPATVQATLYLEVRSRKSKSPFAPPEREHRIYTCDIEIDTTQPDDGVVSLVRQVETWDGTVYLSHTRFRPESYDPSTHIGVYRESYRRSDRLVDDLELYGWKRRVDLESAASREDA